MSQAFQGIAGPKEFARASDVSRETLDRLTAYGNLLEKWQRKINLVGRNTLPQIWHRHFFDSAQLWPLIVEFLNETSVSVTDQDAQVNLVDLGSGAGFPGLVIAILAREAAPEMQVHLIESDHRKCAFLREAARITETNVVLHSDRIEDIEPFLANVITARACAPMDQLLSYAYRFWGPKTRAFFLKGQDVEKELVQATKSWSMVTSVSPSQTDGSGSVLCVKEVCSV